MSRRRRSSQTGGQASWLNTFADLMNLLLCFFVMLFAFSDINVDKFEKLSKSMANSIGISKDKTAMNEVINPGMSQIDGLDKYYSDLEDGSKDTNTNGEVDINKALAEIDKKMTAATSKMYDEVSNLADQYHLSDDLKLDIAPDHKYVQMTLEGTILYDSGKAEIKKESLPILANIGEILKKFKGYNIEITGHTDNVPTSDSSKFKNNNWLSSARALNAAEYLINECGINSAKLKYSGRGEYDPISSNDTEKGRAMNRRIEFKIYNQYSSE